MTTKRAIVKQVEGVAFAGKSDSNHWVTMDGQVSVGGSDAGSRPKELLLMALGGCTGSDVVSILKKKRVSFDRVEIELEGSVREEHPQVFTDIHIEYVVYGEVVNPADVDRAIELSSTKYCAVSAMLKDSVHLTHSYRIESKEKDKSEFVGSM